MFTEISTGIKSWLRAAADPASGVLSYRYGTVEGYPLDWEERLVSKPIVFPAAFVTFAGFKSEGQSRSGAEVIATFGLALVMQNRRTADAARVGGPISSEPGTVRMAQDACGLLQGCDFDLPISGLELIAGEEPALSDPLVRNGIAIFTLQFQTQFTLDTNAFDPTAEFLGVFATLQSEFDLADADQSDLFTTTQTLPQQET